MDGSHVSLTDAFPRVPGFKRLNVRVPDARRLLDEAERHLASVAIPYSVSIHEHYLNGCVDMLCAAQGTEPDAISLNQRKLSSIYTTLTRLGASIDANPLIELFALTRRIRNRIVHYRGDAGNLIEHYKSKASLTGGMG